MSPRSTMIVARRLGLEPGEAEALLAAMRARIGRRSFAIRSAAFVLALPRGLPRAVRRCALVAFAGPLLEHPAARNLYGAGRPWTSDDACAGLVPG